jgi:diaminohydroxyphosphoribosylaminopyrimidine deaminase/5-amino-6-(5-phosphoribosylamino)uracil reductase
MASEVELAAMRRAIVLSANGLGTASPNPPVGCVILDQRQRIVGGGFHRRKGEAHAEVNALAAAGAAARGGTAVVTLEPCNHVGVSPACRQELLDAGVARVVIGVIDPTSRDIGGAATLVAAGVDVEADVLTDEVMVVLAPWLTATQRRRPYLTWAYAAGIDDVATAEEQLARGLRDKADVLVMDKHLAEGIAAGHAPAHFALPPDADLSADLPWWLADSYLAGARSILIVVSDYADMLRHNIDTVDEVVVAQPRTDPLRATAAIDHLPIPTGFRLTAMVAESGTVRAQFRRGAHGHATW